MLADAVTMLAALAAGLLLGLVFFGGLWWTLRKGLASSHPARWFVPSLLARVAVVLGGFYLVGAGQWQRMLVCMLGFWLARMLVLWRTRGMPPTTGPELEAAHAP